MHWELGDCLPVLAKMASAQHEIAFAEILPCSSGGPMVLPSALISNAHYLILIELVPLHELHDRYATLSSFPSAAKAPIGMYTQIAEEEPCMIRQGNSPQGRVDARPGT